MKCFSRRKMRRNSTIQIRIHGMRKSNFIRNIDEKLEINDVEFVRRLEEEKTELETINVYRSIYLSLLFVSNSVDISDKKKHALNCLFSSLTIHYHWLLLLSTIDICYSTASNKALMHFVIVRWNQRNTC